MGGVLRYIRGSVALLIVLDRAGYDQDVWTTSSLHCLGQDRSFFVFAWGVLSVFRGLCCCGDALVR